MSSSTCPDKVDKRTVTALETCAKTPWAFSAAVCPVVVVPAGAFRSRVAVGSVVVADVGAVPSIFWTSSSTLCVAASVYGFAVLCTFSTYFGQRGPTETQAGPTGRMVSRACCKKPPSVLVNGSSAAAGGCWIASAGATGLGSESETTAATGSVGGMVLDMVGIVGVASNVGE